MKAFLRNDVSQLLRCHLVAFFPHESTRIKYLQNLCDEFYPELNGKDLDDMSFSPERNDYRWKVIERLRMSRAVNDMSRAGADADTLMNLIPSSRWTNKQAFKNAMAKFIESGHMLEEFVLIFYVLYVKLDVWQKDIAPVDDKVVEDAKKVVQSRPNEKEPGGVLTEILMGEKSDIAEPFPIDTDHSIVKDMFGEPNVNRAYYYAVRLDDIKRGSIVVSKITFTKNQPNLMTQPLRFKEERISCSGGYSVAVKTYGIVVYQPKVQSLRLIGQSINTAFAEVDNIVDKNFSLKRKPRSFQTIYTADLSFQRPLYTCKGIYHSHMTSNESHVPFATKIVCFKDNIQTSTQGYMEQLKRQMEILNTPSLLDEYFAKGGMRNDIIDNETKNNVRKMIVEQFLRAQGIAREDSLSTLQSEELKKQIQLKLGNLQPIMSMKQHDWINLRKMAVAKEKILEALDFSARDVGNFEPQDANPLHRYFLTRVTNDLSSGESGFGFMMY